MFTHFAGKDDKFLSCAELFVFKDALMWHLVSFIVPGVSGSAVSFGGINVGFETLSLFGA